MDYRSKYLKYKIKYLELKNQYGLGLFSKKKKPQIESQLQS
jgi:hypothetical protein